jgi:regulator of nucleoside diphosphate kinase
MMMNQHVSRYESERYSGPMKNAFGPFLEDAIGVYLQPELAHHPDFHDGWGAVRPRQICLDEDRPRPRKRIVVTREDHSRLQDAVAKPSNPMEREVARVLSRMLSEAQVVCPTCVSPHIVTMNSTVVCEDLETGARYMLRLVYPNEQGKSEMDVSVLQPLGSVLLGRRVGEQPPAPWSSGRSRFSVRTVPYQPEAAGDMHL